MSEWQQEQQQKSASDIVAELYVKMTEANQRFAIDDLTRDDWAGEMHNIDQKLGMFGLRIDRPERFARAVGRHAPTM